MSPKHEQIHVQNIQGKYCTISLHESTKEQLKILQVGITIFRHLLRLIQFK